MKTLLILLLTVSFSSQAQLNIYGPIEYQGYKEGARTVHFSEDGKRIIGDWNDVVEWDIESQTLLSTTKIPGYSTHKSSFDGSSFWFNANSNYNMDVEDITDMYNNFNVRDSSGIIKTNKIDGSYGASAIIKGTKEVVVVASTNTHTHYQVIRLNTKTLEGSLTYFDESRDGASVPSAIKVSEDGKFTAVSFEGENSGLRVYDTETGALLCRYKTESDANDVAFSSDGKYVFVNDGASLLQINTGYWRKTQHWDLKNTITSLDANADGSHVVIATKKKGAFLMNVVNGRIESSLGSGKIADVTFSLDGQYVALGMYKTSKSLGVASVLLYQITY